MKLGITGTPGTGKTTIAKTLGAKKGWPVLELSKIIKNQGLWSHHDENRDTLVADEEAVQQYVLQWVNKRKNYIIEGHLLDTLPRHLFDKVVVLRCDQKDLIRRLEARNYPQSKIQENLQAEIMEVILTDAMYHFGPKLILIINTSEKSIEATVQEIINKIEEK